MGGVGGWREDRGSPQWEGPPAALTCSGHLRELFTSLRENIGTFVSEVLKERLLFEHGIIYSKRKDLGCQFKIECVLTSYEM